MVGGVWLLPPLSSRLTKGQKVVLVDWEMEEAIQHGHQGPEPGELLGEARALSGEVTEDYGHDPMWVSDQQVVPVRGQLYCFHQFWGQWAG